MLLPTYNEDPHHLMARLRAMYESVAATGRETRFDWFLLSDTTDPDIWICEEATFIALRRACGAHRLYYRHRSDNTARKSGNIAEWIRRFGAAYDYMIVLDADSLMAGDTIVRLVHAMEANPEAALIQTQPVIVNARSLFSRLQQFVVSDLAATGSCAGGMGICRPDGTADRTQAAGVSGVDQPAGGTYLLRRDLSAAWRHPFRNAHCRADCSIHDVFSVQGGCGNSPWPRRRMAGAAPKRW